MKNEIKKYWTKNVRSSDRQATPIQCADGFSMSVQASSYHYCSPRENLKNGDYSAWEIGFPSAQDDLLMPFAEDAEKPTDTVYGYVPTNIVNQVIRSHGGIKGPRAALSKARGQT